MSDVEAINQIIQFISSLGVSGIFIWMALRMERKFDALQAQYIADLREIAGLRHALQQTQLHVSNYGGSENITPMRKENKIAE